VTVLDDWAIETAGLKRSFGNSHALSGFDVKVPAGKVTGLVGPNGAGKTTLLLILAGLLAPDSGTAKVGGADPVSQPYEVHREVGWMPDFFGVYDGLTALEYLELFGAAYQVPAAERTPRAKELLDLVNLQSFSSSSVHTMSRGQKQRLGFARAIVHKPKVLLLDEPASGLDPRARIELRELVRAEAAAGASVLVSSHILSELEEMVDLVVFAEKGKCKGVYPLNELPAGALHKTWRFRALDSAQLEKELSALELSATFIGNGAGVVALENDQEAADLIAHLVRAGVRLVEATRDGGGLEGAFMAMDEGERR
jgi:ABC-2 type transport system ATP-binding protein